MTKNSVKLAVLSDLHAYNSASHQDASAPSYLDIASERTPECCPISALLSLIDEEDITADIVLCPGDFGDRACRESLVFAWEKVHEVASKLGAARVIASTGNHDVDSRHVHNEYDPIEELKSLQPMFPIDDEHLAMKYWSYHFHVYSDDAVTIVNLNSSAYHASGLDELEHGRIAMPTLSRLEKELLDHRDTKLKILLCHHNPHKHSEFNLGEHDQIKGGQLLLDFLADVTDQEWLLVHGHKHHPKVTYAAGGASAPVVFSAGSIASTLYPDLKTDTGNQFHLIDVPMSKLQQLGLVGTFRTWDWHVHYGWRAADSSKGLPAHGGFGHRESPARLAARIAKWVAKREGYSSSDDLLKKFPELKHVVPTDLQRLDRNLQVHGYAIDFEATGRITQVVQHVTQ